MMMKPRTCNCLKCLRNICRQDGKPCHRWVEQGCPAILLNCPDWEDT